MFCCARKLRSLQDSLASSFVDAQTSFIQPQMHPYDLYFYDPVLEEYTVNKYVSVLCVQMDLSGHTRILLNKMTVMQCRSCDCVLPRAQVPD